MAVALGALRACPQGDQKQPQKDKIAHDIQKGTSRKRSGTVGHEPQQDRAVVPMFYRAGPLRLSMFSTYAQFRSAEDVALSEMKIELMFPADPETEAYFQALPQV